MYQGAIEDGMAFHWGNDHVIVTRIIGHRIWIKYADGRRLSSFPTTYETWHSEEDFRRRAQPFAVGLTLEQTVQNAITKGVMDVVEQHVAIRTEMGMLLAIIPIRRRDIIAAVMHATRDEGVRDVREWDGTL